jgi:hypothetical protein
MGLTEVFGSGDQDCSDPVSGRLGPRSLRVGAAAWLAQRTLPYSGCESGQVC